MLVLDLSLLRDVAVHLEGLHIRDIVEERGVLEEQLFIEGVGTVGCETRIILHLLQY